MSIAKNYNISLYIFSVSLLVLFYCCHSTETNESNTQWQEITSKDFSAPTGRHAGDFINVDEKIYLIGGRGLKSVDVYDINENKWIEKSPPPIELHHFQAVAHDHLIYVIGAMSGPYPYEKPIEHVVIYDTDEDSWIRGVDIPKERRRGSVGVVKKGFDIYIMCGIKNGHIGDHKKWLDRYNILTNEWEILEDAPRARDHFQAVLFEDKIYAIGGRTTKAYQNAFKNTIKEVDIYDIKSNTWSTAPDPIPTERAGTSASLFNGNVIIGGGESFYQAMAHDEVEVLNAKDLSWRKFGNMPRGRHGTGMTIVNSRLYISSGGTHQGGGPEMGDLWVLPLE